MEKTMTCGTALVSLAKRGIAADSAENAIQMALDAKFPTKGDKYTGPWKKPEEVECHAKDPANCRFHHTGIFAKAKNKDLFDPEKFGAYSAEDINAFLKEQFEAAGIDAYIGVTLEASSGKFTVELDNFKAANHADFKDADKAKQMVENFIFDIGGASIDKYGNNDSMWDEMGKSEFVGEFTTPESEDMVDGGGDDDDGEKVASALNDDTIEGDDNVAGGQGKPNPDGNDNIAEKAKGGGEIEVEGATAAFKSPADLSEDDIPGPEKLDEAYLVLGKLQIGQVSPESASAELKNILGVDVDLSGKSDDELETIAELLNDTKQSVEDQTGEGLEYFKDAVGKMVSKGVTGEKGAQNNGVEGATLTAEQADDLETAAGEFGADWFMLKYDPESETYSVHDTDAGKDITIKEALGKICETVESMDWHEADQEAKNKLNSILKAHGMEELTDAIVDGGGDDDGGSHSAGETKSAAGAAPGYSHGSASKEQKAQTAVNALAAKAAAAKDPQMKAVYEKMLAKLQEHHGVKAAAAPTTAAAPAAPSGGTVAEGGGKKASTPKSKKYKIPPLSSPLQAWSDALPKELPGFKHYNADAAQKLLKATLDGTINGEHGLSPIGARNSYTTVLLHLIGLYHSIAHKGWLKTKKITPEQIGPNLAKFFKCGYSTLAALKDAVKYSKDYMKNGGEAAMEGWKQSIKNACAAHAAMGDYSKLHHAAILEVQNYKHDG